MTGWAVGSVQPAVVASTTLHHGVVAGATASNPSQTPHFGRSAGFQRADELYARSPVPLRLTRRFA
jgi:hypothetical protein